MHDAVLGIDIGGTSVKLGLVGRHGEILARREASVSFDGYKTPILITVLDQAERFLQEQGLPVFCIGVSATGQVDEQTGVVIGTNGKIPGYEGCAVKAGLEKRFGLPARVLNDANAAALGECRRGRGKGKQNVVMVTLGTGVGGGILCGGRLLMGKRGIAGEIGHFTLYADGAACSCGSRGCYESYASVTALVRNVEERTGEQNLSGREIFRRAEQGEEIIRKEIGHWIKDVGRGLIGLVHIFNPELLLIGGGVSCQEELLMKPLRNMVLTGVMPRFAEGLEVERAVLGNDAGMIGAAAFALLQDEA